jgi:hypothetical protein
MVLLNHTTGINTSSLAWIVYFWREVLATRLMIKVLTA